MANALSFLADPEYWRSVRETAPNSLGKLAQGLAVNTVNTVVPVDLVNMVLRPMGLGSDNPILGQNHLAKLLNVSPDDPSFNIGAMLPTDPTDLAHGLPVLAGIFAGKGAKTADALMLAKAQDMAKAGAQYPYEPAYFEQATGVPLNSLIVRKGDGVAMSVEFRKYMPPKQLGGAFPEMAGVEKRPNPAVVSVNSDLSLKTLPDGRFQADYSPLWGGKENPFSAIGDNPQELIDAALRRINRSSKALEAGKKYDTIPRTWKGDARNIAKKLIDEYGDVQFGMSTQSKSKYVILPTGEKIRMSDHALPNTYDSPDYDFRYGGDIESFIRSISKGA